MDNFDELSLERASQNQPPERPRGSRAPILVVAAAGLLVGGGAAWWWTRSDRTPPAPVATHSTEAAVSEVNEPAHTLPPLGQMDTFLRALLGALTTHPDFARWLATDDLIHQMASGIDRISRGQSPAGDLAVLRPTGDFDVARRSGTITIDTATFRRYDRLASLVDSLEARGVVEAYRTIHPRLDEAYRALGRTEGGIDDAVDAALQLLLDVPATSGTIVVVPGKGATYAYRDAQQEQLQPIQKQLLRMGPENVRRIQARLRAIRAELAKSDNRAR
jgi:hypothetical protein